MGAADNPVDVLIVGAGPTGLALAAQLAAWGVRPRIVDRGQDRVHESRALAVQPRTLEVLAGLGVTDQFVASGNPAVGLCLHARGRKHAVPLFDVGLADTAYPYLLFLSQAQTERILGDRLAAAGLAVERGVELVDLRSGAEAVAGTLRHADGSAEVVHARYVVGCDGAHSTVRRAAGIAFVGGAYPQTFVLADLEADSLDRGMAHAFLSGNGMLFFFPLGAPASWRLLAMRPPADRTPPDSAPTLDQLQAIADAYTASSVRLHDPVWTTNFRLHHRAATRYRTGRVFLAGDAAHIHSPAGAQGMNTSIQDAINLGWKLAHTLHGTATSELLDTYEPERAPIGRTVLRFTDRAFTIATSTNPIVRFARGRLAPALIPVLLRVTPGRTNAFRALAQLGIHYRRSPLSHNGPNPPRHGPRAGDRLPDAPIVHNGQPSTLHAAVAAPAWHLLLCDAGDAWPAAPPLVAAHSTAGLLHVQHLSVHHPGAHHRPGVLHDATGQATRRLGLTDRPAHYLIRPDGHIAYRASGTNLTGLSDYLTRWLPTAQPAPTRPDP